MSVEVGAPAGGVAVAAQEEGALTYPSALTPTSSWWVLVALCIAVSCMTRLGARRGESGDCAPRREHV
jgi:hypothetical protein